MSGLLIRRRTPAGVARGVMTLLVVVAVVVLVAGCSGDDHPRSLVDRPSGSGTGTTQTLPTSRSSGQSASPSLTFSSASTTSAILDYPHLFAAMSVVPAKAAVVSFTDLDLVKKRLGYADVTSESPTSERFDFWERARADGAMFTGTRLYDDASVMSLDYGWTGDDVAWEVDFAVTEEGCRRSMICDTARGYVLGLRPDLDWSVVTRSLQDNGFEEEGSDPNTFRTNEDTRAPFDLVHLIPELHAVAGGNEIGIQRLADVVEGAPPYAPAIGAVYDRLGTVESLQASTGCVDLPNALGPDSTADDVTAFLMTDDISSITPAVSTVVSVTGRRDASIEVEVGAEAPNDDLTERTAAIRSWPGLQSGTPFENVADVTSSRNGDFETYAVDVADMPTFRAMVLTDDAPWALCPYTETR